MGDVPIPIFNGKDRDVREVVIINVDLNSQNALAMAFEFITFALGA